ncbi:MAG: glycosyltransferase [Oscillospiraceae bacterium]
MENKPVKVSVIMLSYNHERYIAHAIESVISQKTDFETEILIGDDGSSDNSAEIIREYARKYPHIITAFIRPENLGATRNSFDLLCRARGQYIAACEGDDFWTDEYKLQKQCDFLDEHEEYSAVASESVIVDENDREYAHTSDIRWICKKRDMSLKDFRGIFLPGQPSSLMRRNFFLEDGFEKELFLTAHHSIGDRTTAVQWLCRGRIYRLPPVLSAYRIPKKENRQNMTQTLYSKSSSIIREDSDYTDTLYEYAKKNYKGRFSFDYHRTELLFSALKKRDLSSALYIFRKMSLPLSAFIYIFPIIISRIKEKIRKI